MRRGLDVVLPGVHARDPARHGLREPEPHARVRVLRCVRRAVGEHDLDEVVMEVAVAGAAAEHRRPHVPVGVDHPGHRDEIAPVDHLGARRVDARCDAGDHVAVDEQIARAGGPGSRRPSSTDARRESGTGSSFPPGVRLRAGARRAANDVRCAGLGPAASSRATPARARAIRRPPAEARCARCRGRPRRADGP